MGGQGAVGLECPGPDLVRGPVPEAREWLDQLSRIGTPAPVLCAVVSVHHAVD
ncbi:MAG TPA: hypothetical protein VHO07_19925 [Streptosporangiaceae bacterium]|nr:hypothetical protein [Streptosporangiaceae bacterium]